jgi:hypothetical protein
MNGQDSCKGCSYMFEVHIELEILKELINRQLNSH